MDSVEVVDELKVASTSHKGQKNRSYTMEFKKQRCRPCENTQHP